MNNNIFDIDYPKLVALTTPPDLRKNRLMALLNALVMPVRTTYGNFKNNRINSLYKLNHNGQVCYLRKALNDAFDADLRRIYIGDGNKYDRQYIYTNVEQQPKYLGKIYLHQVGDFSDTGVDFRVVLPQGFDLTNNIYQLMAMIDFYKLASKRYLIEIE